MMEIEATNREERAELAYAIWSTEAAGSVAKTAELTGFPVPSIQRWKREDNWHRRLESERFGDTNEAVEHAANMIRSAMPQVAERMISIAAGTRPLVNNEGKLVIDPETNKPVHVPMADNKDAINAARWLMQYGMMSAYDILRDGATGTQAMPAAYGLGGPPQSNTDKLTSIINATYQENNTRTGKKR